MAERLQRDGHDHVTFVGTPHGLEARLVPEAGVEFFSVPSRGFDRSRPWTAVSAAFTVLASLSRAVALVRRARPDVVVGFGGYVSVPLGVAALLTGTPLVLAEQNSVPGLANRSLSRWARAVAIAYPVSREHLKHPERAVHTGNPVREAVLSADRDAGRRALGIADDAVLLLVFGGSRGARHINRAVIAAWPQLEDLATLTVVHVAGKAEAASVREAVKAAGIDAARYHVFDYIEDMGGAMAAADLILGRAGATSIAEITAIGRAAVLVPYPYATDDHQTLNARALEGAAVMVSDVDLDAPAFGETLRRLLEDGERRTLMARASRGYGMPDAADRLVAVIHGAAKTR